VTPASPYVGLDCFREEDAALFFGRDAERTRIIGNLRASRLTLLHAESGVGKSSLLRAGVSARLRELVGGARADANRFVPVVFSRWSAAPTPAVIASIEESARSLLGPDAELVVRDRLRDAIDDVSRAVDATLLVILDQFEEHFLYGTGEDDPFDDELARCIVDRDLRAHFLISVREDAYALIGQRYKARIPNVYGNYLHLDFLDERAARSAVVEPVAAFNRGAGGTGEHVEIDPALVDAVLDGVRRGRVTIGDESPSDATAGDVVRIETAYLQLVMKRIWDEELGAGSHRLRTETLRRLGGAGTIVRAHLDDAMSGLTAGQRDAAAQALRFMVTSGGRKIALSSQELGEFSGLPAEPLEPALAALERERILRPVPSPDLDGAPRRELYHDVLAPAVLDWRRRHRDEEATQELARARARSRRLEVRNRRLAAAVIALAAAIAALGIYTWNPVWLRRLELASVDARFHVRGTADPDPRLMLVAVDDETLARLAPEGERRIPRSYYARMLRRIHADGPAVIAVDVIFAQPWVPRDDRALRAAIRATRDRLVLVYTDFSVEPEADGTQTIRPILFGQRQPKTTPGGYAGLPPDADRRIRRANYVVDFAREGSPDVTARAFAFAAADVARGGRLRGRLDDLPVASGREWDDQNPDSTWIDHPGPAGSVPRTSALDVLGGRVRPGAFRDKLVVIGVTARSSRDKHPTPFSDRESGAEIQAAAISTMVRGSPLRDPDPFADVLAVVLVATLGAAAAFWRWRAVAIPVVAVVFLAIAQLLFQEGRILAVVAPLCALALAVVGVLVFGAARRARRFTARTDTR
jgi:CHASE2 domain-containing sensor protein